MSVNNFKLEFETAAGITSVTQGEPESVNAKLNRLAKECGYNNIGTSAVNIIREENQDTGVTLLFNRTGDDAFQLTNAIAARMTMYDRTGRNRVPVDYVGTVAVKRVYIGYSALARINNAVDMQRVMGPLINESIKDFIDEVGFIGIGYTITAERPGGDGLYFRDLDNAAGMEFRLCLIKG